MLVAVGSSSSYIKDDSETVDAVALVINLDARNATHGLKIYTHLCVCVCVKRSKSKKKQILGTTAFLGGLFFTNGNLLYGVCVSFS